MLQLSSGMSALSLPRISQPSAPRAVSLAAVLRFSCALLLGALTKGEAQSLEKPKDSAMQRSGCCMGVALFWCPRHVGLNLCTT